jgi:hypothetical protein
MSNQIRSAAVLIPPKVRAGIYAGLGVLAAAEGIILLVHHEFGGVITAIFGIAQALGFVVARSNVPRHNGEQRVVRVQRH